MILLLPPSETKRDGGQEGTRLALEALSFPALTSHRQSTLTALEELSRDDASARAALRLGSTQDDELRRNRTVHTSALLPALDRYTGVLFDALDAETLDDSARAFAAQHLVIHSALFGLVRGGDGIPAYRLSHDSRLPGASMRARWRRAVSTALEGEAGLVLDLRSSSYTALGPAPSSAWTIRVVSEEPDGRRVALSHFNKAAKGAFARAVAQSRIVHESADALLHWAAARRIRLERSGPHALELVA